MPIHPAPAPALRSFASRRPPRAVVVAVATLVNVVLSVPAFADVPIGWSLTSTVDGGTGSLGTSIAATDGVAIVGAPFAALTDGGAPVGAALVYTYGAGGWSAQTVAAQSPIDGGNFGTSVAASGNLGAVGAVGTPPAAYALAATAGVYQSVQSWPDPASDTNQSFGGSVAVLAVDGGISFLAVAAPPGSANPNGTVYVSRQIAGGAWSDPPAAITDPAAQAFGIALAFAGNGELLVGDPATDAGQVLRYSPLPDGGWASAGSLPFSLDGGQVQQFGNGIATWKNLAVVTAPGTSDDAGTYNGVAFLFAANDAGVWEQATVLTGSAAETFGNFTPAINGAFIAIGSAINTASSGVGRVDVWAESGGAWVPAPSLAPAADPFYGQAVGIVGSTIFVGDTTANAAASISEVTSTLLIYSAVYADAGSVGDASDGGGSVDGSAPGPDGSEPLPSPDAASIRDGAVTSADGSTAGASSGGGCGCAFAGQEGGGEAGGALAVLAESVLAGLVWTRRRRRSRQRPDLS